MSSKNNTQVMSSSTENVESSNQKIFDLIAAIREKTSAIHADEYGDMTAEVQNLLVHLFDDVPDPRVPGRCRYSLGKIICLLLLTIARLGKCTCTSIADRIYTCRRTFFEMGLLDKREREEGEEDIPEDNLIITPSHDTIRRILSVIDFDSLKSHLDQKISGYLDVIGDGCSSGKTHISIDGKVVRGSGRSSNAQCPLSNIQVLNIYNNTTAVCVYSKAISEKTNEIPVAQDYLKAVSLKNTVVTFDALHTQRETLKIISHKRGIYVAPVKDNQPGLKEEIIARFEKAESSGKIEHRSMCDRDFDIYMLPKSYATDGFTGMKVFIRMLSHVRQNDDTQMYFIANTTDIDLALEAICQRWEIEDDFHREKDWLVQEDHVYLTNKRAVLNIVLINNYIIACARLYSALTGLSFRLSKDEMRESPEKIFTFLSRCMSDQELTASLQEQLQAARRKSAKSE